MKTCPIFTITFSLIVAMTATVSAQTNVFPSSGNAGIGTTSPIGNMDIKADATNAGRTPQLYIEGATDANKKLYLGINTTGDFASLEYVNEGNHWGPLALQSDGGDVGIGTSQPEALFDLGSSAGVKELLYGSSAANQGYVCGFGVDLVSGTNSLDLFIGHGTGSDTAFNVAFPTSATFPYSGYTAALTVRNTGNVGIGTINPAYKLDVNGPIAIEQKNFGGGAGLYVIGNSPATCWPNIGFGMTNTAGATVEGASVATQIVNNTAGTEAMDLVFYTATAGSLTEKVRITGSGNVGIGTADPTYPLTVNGTIRAKEVIVDTGWSDYVFEPRYHLEPLAEVASYIKTHHHLQGIPTASQVKAGGVSLGQMQAKLLAKVEELTLYMVRLQKEDLALKAANISLERRVASLESR